MARKPTDEVQLKLRFKESLRRRLEREAKLRERSMNAEIIARLHDSFNFFDHASRDERIVSDIELALFSVTDQLNEVQSQVRAILSHLNLPDPAKSEDGGEKE